MSWADDGVTGGQTYTYRIRVEDADGSNLGAFGANAIITTSSSDQGYPGAVLEDHPTFYWRLDETAEQDAATRTAVHYLRARVWDSSGNGQEGTAERGWTSLHRRLHPRRPERAGERRRLVGDASTGSRGGSPRASPTTSHPRCRRRRRTRWSSGSAPPEPPGVG